MPLSHVYLKEDHLEWWSATPPGAAAVRAVGQSRYRAFLSEFFSNVSWVAGDQTGSNDYVDSEGTLNMEGSQGGGGTPAIFDLFPMRRTDWRNAPTAFQPGPDLRVRGAVSNGNLPFFEAIRFRGDRDPQRRVIRTEDRSSIWIDFAQPQRVVGLQCGFAGGPDRGLNQGNFKLEAWRTDGSLVALASGSDLKGATDWQPYAAELIAVRDHLAGIRTVRLFCDDPGFEPNESLFLYRVWYETLPVALVKQGTIINTPLVTFRGHQHRQHVDLPPAPGNPAAESLQRSGDPAVATVPQDQIASGMIGFGSITLQLPMDCDRAQVFVRGFKVIPGVGGARRREPHVQKFSKLGFALNTTQYPTAQARQITFVLNGEYRWGEEDEERDDVLLAVYWTVLAWRSDRADLFSLDLQQNTVDHKRRDKTVISARHGRPALDAATLANGGAAGVYGALFGGLTRYRLTMPRPVEPQVYAFGLGLFEGTFPSDEFFDDETRPLWEYIIGGLATGWSIGVAGGTAFLKWFGAWVGDGARIQPAALLPAPLQYSGDGTQIEWGWTCDLIETLDIPERASTWVMGTVLSGRSLVPDILSSHGEDDDRLVRTVQGDAGARESNDSAFHTYSLGVPLSAEQCLVVMQGFTFKPEDEVRELDVEVRAGRFDGQRLTLLAGAGVELTEQPQGLVDEPAGSIGGGAGFSNPHRLALGWPNVVGVNRVEKAIRTVLTTRTAEFDWVDGTRDESPKVVGYIRNDGNVPVGVRALRITGLQAPAFDLSFRYRGSTLFLNLFLGVMPLTLMPGERVEIVGRFSPAGVPANAPVIVGAAAVARAVFSLTLGQPDVGVDIRAERRVLQPGGFFFPPTPVPRLGQVRVTPGFQVIGGGSNVIGSITVRPPDPPNAIKRVFAIMNFGQDALVVRSLAFAPPVGGLSFRVTRYPMNLGQLRPAGNTRFVIEPGTSLDCELIWAPTRVGPMRTRLVADTNQGPLAMEIDGEGIPAP